MAEIETAAMRTPLEEALEVVSQWFAVRVDVDTPQRGGFSRWCCGPVPLPQGVPYRQPEPFSEEQGPRCVVNAIMDAFPRLPLHIGEQRALLAFVYHFRKIASAVGYTHPYDDPTNGLAGLVQLGPEYDGVVVRIHYENNSVSLVKP
jgi:hypothetical protein